VDEYKNNFKSYLEKLICSMLLKRCTEQNELCCANQVNGYVLQQNKGYKYYNENHSLAIHQVKDKILKDCEIL